MHSSLRLCHKDKMELPYEPMKRTTTALKQEKRSVYDGGVLPDIQLEETKTSTIANALLKNDGIFNYATSYYYRNPI
jgi:carboxyl-terminal processing protease